MTHNPSLLPTAAARRLPSVAGVIEQFTALDYVCSKETATAVFLMVHLQRPLLVEGPPGVGKTELAKVLAQATGRSCASHRAPGTAYRKCRASLARRKVLFFRAMLY